MTLSFFDFKPLAYLLAIMPLGQGNKTMTIHQTMAALLEAKDQLNMALAENKLTPNALPCFAVFTDDWQLDQVCYSKADAKREAKDLVKLGCGVKIKAFDSEELAYAYAEKQAGKITNWGQS